MLDTTSFPFVTRPEYEIVDLKKGVIEVNVGGVVEIGDMELNTGGAILDVSVTLE